MKQLFQTTLILSAAVLLSRSAEAQQFTQVNLVTDDKAVHPAVIEDPSLKNAWGVSFGGTTPFWVSDNGAGVSTLYNVNPVTDAPVKQGLTVTIPGDGSVTGQAFNSSSSFNGDRFLFVSEDGTISGWRGALGTTAEVLQLANPDNIYKGTAVDTIGNSQYLLSANFHTGKIDILKGDAGAPDLAGNFTDPGIPSGFAPFNIRNLDGKLYVTYAKQNGKDDAPGPGNGFVSVFDVQGNFVGRIGSGGTLNSPWGLEIAPASFGPLAGDLLVGNFGDGTINAFDLNSATFKGQLLGTDGNPLSIEGLWALTVGNNGGGGSSDKLYFTAGPDDEEHGLFGLLQLPDSGSTFEILAGALGILGLGRKRSKA